MISQLGDRLDVVLVTREVTGQDSYGNDEYGDVETEVRGCAVQPRNTSEDVSAREQVFSEYVLHAPLGTDLDSVDAVVVAGVRYDVLGRPKVWNGFGDEGFLEVGLTRWTG